MNKHVFPMVDIDMVHGDAVQSLRQLANKSIDLIVTSPPYNIGKDYEKKDRLNSTQYDSFIGEVISVLSKKIKQNGSVCWQVGNQINNGELFPLDYLAYKYFSKGGFKLRNRIIWRFNFGLNSRNRFSGRYETLLWFTKGDQYKFNLDPVRVPQLYPGKRHSAGKGEKAGALSGNPLGKNPSDFWEFKPAEAFMDGCIWEIPNVKANHPEKTIHPCQFPVELAERCILALTNEGDFVVDPFAGVGATVIAAEKHGRIGLGIDRDADYVALAKRRLEQFRMGELPLRPLGRPVVQPNITQKVAKFPLEWMDGEGKS